MPNEAKYFIGFAFPSDTAVAGKHTKPLICTALLQVQIMIHVIKEGPGIFIRFQGDISIGQQNLTENSSWILIEIIEFFVTPCPAEQLVPGQP